MALKPKKGKKDISPFREFLKTTRTWFLLVGVDEAYFIFLHQLATLEIARGADRTCVPLLNTCHSFHKRLLPFTSQRLYHWATSAVMLKVWVLLVYIYYSLLLPS